MACVKVEYQKEVGNARNITDSDSQISDTFY